MEPKFYLQTKPNLLKRAVAFFVDYGIIFSYFALMIYLYGEPNEEGGYSVNGFPGFSITLVWLVVLIGAELLIGRTLGNQLMNLRAIPKEEWENNLSFKQSFLRHLMDMIDVVFYGLIAIILIKRTEHNQRLGDLLGKTIVIDETDEEQGKKII